MNSHKLKKGKDGPKIASEVADLVTELLTKKSTVLTCHQCEHNFLNTITAVTHIETSHVEVLNKVTVLLNALGEDKNPNKRVRQMLKARHPSLISLSNVSFCVPILGSKNVTCFV